MYALIIKLGRTKQPQNDLFLGKLFTFSDFKKWKMYKSSGGWGVKAVGGVPSKLAPSLGCS